MPLTRRSAANRVSNATARRPLGLFLDGVENTPNRSRNGTTNIMLIHAPTRQRGRVSVTAVITTPCPATRTCFWPTFRQPRTRRAVARTLGATELSSLPAARLLTPQLPAVSVLPSFPPRCVVVVCRTDSRSNEPRVAERRCDVAPAPDRWPNRPSSGQKQGGVGAARMRSLPCNGTRRAGSTVFCDQLLRRLNYISVAEQHRELRAAGLEVIESSGPSGRRVDPQALDGAPHLHYLCQAAAASRAP